MARANVAGLKTMTRRVINPQPADDIRPWDAPNKKVLAWISSLKHSYGPTTVHVPKWQVGDLIYQKERWRVGSVDRNTIWYDDNTAKVLPDAADNLAGKFLGNKNKLSLFMYSWAARFWAEIISIKVERVRDISEADALKEGIAFVIDPATGWAIYGTEGRSSAVRAYQDLYDRINGVGGFDRDWCWAIQYREMKR